MSVLWNFLEEKSTSWREAGDTVARVVLTEKFSFLLTERVFSIRIVTRGKFCDVRIERGFLSTFAMVSRLYLCDFLISQVKLMNKKKWRSDSRTVWELLPDNQASF